MRLVRYIRSDDNLEINEICSVCWGECMSAKNVARDVRQGSENSNAKECGKFEFCTLKKIRPPYKEKISWVIVNNMIYHVAE